MQRSASSSPGLRHGISSRYLRTNSSDRNLLSSGSTPLTRSERTDALMGRLEELLVFEILKDGGATYKRFSVRTLYKYVINSITCGGLTDYPRPVEASRLRAAGGRRKAAAASDSFGDEESDGDNDGDECEAGAPLKPSTTRRRRLNKRNKLESIKEAESMATEDVQKDDDNRAPDNEVTYRERLGGFLHPRDMRKLVTPFSASNEPEMIVRRHAILLNFDPMRAIILRDRLLVLVPDGADSILVELERRVRGGSELESIGGKSVSTRLLDAPGEVVQDLINDPMLASASKGVSPFTDSTSSAGSNKSNVKRVVSAVMSNIPTRFRIGVSPISASASVHDTLRGSVHETEKSAEAPTEMTHMDSAVSSLNSDGSDSFNSFVDNEWNELEGRDWINLPFELQSVDAVLHSVASILAEDVLELQLGANSIIAALLAPRADIGDHAQEILRNMKNSIEEMRSRVKGYVRAIDVLLEDYEDMSLMNLSRLLTHPDRFIQPVPQAVLEEESDEPELILESHLQEGNTLTNALLLIQGQLNTTEDFVSRKSDSIRNRLLYIDLVISTLSLSVTVGSFVGSIFGMNLLNGYENDQNLFRIVVFATLGGCVVMVLIMLFVIRRLGALPSLFN